MSDTAALAAIGAAARELKLPTVREQAARLAAAIVGRVTYNAHIIETGTQSYRLATSKNRRPTSTSGSRSQNS